MADDAWIEWGGELIRVVGFTSGGAPYGLRVCDFDRADLEAMCALDVAALEEPGSYRPQSPRSRNQTAGFTTTTLRSER
jgi:hypothetical protein